MYFLISDITRLLPIMQPMLRSTTLCLSLIRPPLMLHQAITRPRLTTPLSLLHTTQSRATTRLQRLSEFRSFGGHSLFALKQIDDLFQNLYYRYYSAPAYYSTTEAPVYYTTTPAPSYYSAPSYRR